MTVVSGSQIFLLGTAFAVLYIIHLVIYRLYFSPIAHIPGPLIARLTFWYEVYYDAVKKGQYMWKIEELHKQYGPIIRISPEEVHIRDADFFDEVYSGPGKKRNKWKRVNQSHVNREESVFATIEHDLHRKRRGVLNSFFSKRKVRSLQPSIVTVIEGLLRRFDQFSGTGEPLNVSDAFAALTYDIVFEYTFGCNEGHVDAPDFAPAFRKVCQKGAAVLHLSKPFPWLPRFLQSIPESIAVKLEPAMVEFAKSQKVVERMCLDIYNSHMDGTEKSPEDFDKTIFHTVLHNPNVHESMKHPKRLWQDGFTVVGAGTITTSETLSWSVYGLLTNPHSLRKLKNELREAMPDWTSPLPPITELEKLPYLTAIIQEALRLSNGVTVREPLIDPEQPIIYTAKPDENGQRQETIVPPNTPVSMTPLLIHFDPELFPYPRQFAPERWIPGSDFPQANPKYFVPFFRGTRMCLGINLAYTELYLTLAMLFRHYGSNEVRDPDGKGWLQLFEFDFQRDLAITGDGLLPIYADDSKGVRLLIRTD